VLNDFYAKKANCKTNKEGITSQGSFSIFFVLMKKSLKYFLNNLLSRRYNINTC